MRMVLATMLFVPLLLAASMLGACSRDPAPGPDIEFIAHGFRLEGARFGADALQRRFAGDRPDWGDAMADPDALARFLAASRPVVLCRSAESAVVAYHGPPFGALLLTRWTLGRAARLEAVEVVPAVALADENGPPIHWAEALARAEGPNPAQLAFAEVAAQRAQAAGGLAACEAGTAPGGQSPVAPVGSNGEPRPAALSGLITPREAGQSLLELFDSARGAAAVHRGVLALFQRGDADPLTRLFGADALAPLAAITKAEPRLQLVPVTRLGATRGPAEQHLIVYADLLQPGRFVLVTAVIPAALGAPPGPATPTPGVRPEFRATLVQP